MDKGLPGEIDIGQRLQEKNVFSEGLSFSDEGFEDWVLLKDTLARLPSPYAQVLWLRFGQGWSQARLAERFGVGQPQISRWERRGKELLRQALKYPDKSETRATAKPLQAGGQVD